MSLLTTSGSMLRIDIMDSSSSQIETSSDDVSLLWREYEKSFICRWGSNQKTTHSIGVGYCSGGNNTLWEAFEGGLELSRILGCATVNGVYIAKSSSLGACSGERTAVDLIVQDWERFFACHEGVYVQYIDGVPGEVLDSALKDYPHKESILLVGMNCISAPKHKHSICLRSTGFYCADPRALLLPTSNYSEGVFLLKFADPLFCPYIVYTFQVASVRYPNSSSGLHPVLEALSKNPLLDPATPSAIGGLLGDTVQKVQKMYTTILAGRAKYSSFFLNRMSALFFSSVRLINYTLILTQSCENSCSPSVASPIGDIKKSANVTSLLPTMSSPYFSNVASILATSTVSAQSTTSRSAISPTIHSTINNTSNLVMNSSEELNQDSTVTHLLLSVSNRTISAFIQSTNASSISTEMVTAAISNSSVSLAIDTTSLFSNIPIHVTHTNGETFVSKSLVLWIIFGTSQMILLSRLQLRCFRLRFMALLVNAFGPVFALIDMIQNMQVRHCHCILHITLVIYGIAQIAKEGWRITLPAVRQAMQYVAMTVTQSHSLSDCNVIKIGKPFRRAMQCTRIVLECANLTILASLFFTGYFVCQDHCVAADIIYGVLAFLLATCLAIFILFARRTQHPRSY